MTILSKNQGYTIIELLIALNIAMIIISLSATLYYVYTTYTTGLVRITENQQYALRSLEYIHSVLDKSERFTVRYENEILTFVPDGEMEIIISSESILRDDIAVITGVEEISIITASRNGVTYNTELPVNGLSDYRQYDVKSEDVSLITISITIGGKKYTMSYHPRDIANRRFRNITG